MVLYEERGGREVSDGGGGGRRLQDIMTGRCGDVCIWK